jgi:hypothetical protein
MIDVGRHFHATHRSPIDTIATVDSIARIANLLQRIGESHFAVFLGLLQLLFSWISLLLSGNICIYLRLKYSSLSTFVLILARLFVPFCALLCSTILLNFFPQYSHSCYARHLENPAILGFACIGLW